jgi:hypothetical protein
VQLADHKVIDSEQLRLQLIEPRVCMLPLANGDCRKQVNIKLPGAQESSLRHISPLSLSDAVREPLGMA